MIFSKHTDLVEPLQFHCQYQSFPYYQLQSGWKCTSLPPDYQEKALLGGQSYSGHPGGDKQRAHFNSVIFWFWFLAPPPFRWSFLKENWFYLFCHYLTVVNCLNIQQSRECILNGSMNFALLDSTDPCSRATVFTGPEVADATLIIRWARTIQNCCTDGKSDRRTGQDFGDRWLIILWCEQAKSKMIWAQQNWTNKVF